MERLLVIAVCITVSLSGVTCEDTIHEVSTYLHGTVTLPCFFSFISGPEELLVSWVKRDPNKVVHSYYNGADDLTNQDPEFKGRTEMSISFSKGNVYLTLQNVGFEDEGNYSCLGSNKKDHGEVNFRISIDSLHGEDPVVMMVLVDGKKQLKCSSVGFYKKPEIVWQSKELDLSEFVTTPSRTPQPDGRLLVESVLNIDVKPNVHYLCHVKEGRLKSSIRAVQSDGKHSIKLIDEY